MKSRIYIIKTLTTKNILAVSSISLMITTILNMRQILLALAIIIIIDMLTGIRKSIFIKGIKVNICKKEFWHAINSSGLRSTWRKTYEYAIGILVFAIMDSLVLKSSGIELMGVIYTLSEIGVALACMVEIYSIYENMEAVSGNNLLKKLTFLLPKRMQKMFDSKVEIDPQDNDEDIEMPPTQNYD